MKLAFAFTALLASFLSSVNGQDLFTLAGNSGLTTLDAALAAAGLVGAVNGSATGPLTVFAPSNQAFADIQSVVDMLLSPGYVAHLRNVLTYHVTEGNVSSSMLTNGMIVPMLNMENVTVDLTTGVQLIDTQGGVSTVVTPDVFATNGVAHVIDRVLLPSFVGKSIYNVLNMDPTLSTLVSVVPSSLVDVINSTDANLTIFAPSNDAFAAMNPSILGFIVGDENALIALLSNHAVAGSYPAELLRNGETIKPLAGPSLIVSISNGMVMINNAMVVEADKLANNGIVHKLNEVILPTFLEVPNEFPQLALLKAAIDGYMLRDVIANGNYTIFAPTNDAFSAALTQLLKTNPLLANAIASGSPNWSAHVIGILLHHVAPGILSSNDLTTGPLTMVDGFPVVVNVTTNGVKVDTANVVKANIPRQNAFIHIIDSLLFPFWASLNLIDFGKMIPKYSTMLALTSRIGLDKTLSGYGDAGYTLLAASNQAFNDSGIDPSSLTDEQLKYFLDYHVIPGVYPVNLFQNGTLKTLNGQTVQVAVYGHGNITVNGKALQLNNYVLAKNGIGYQIDGVLMPPMTNAPTTMAPTTMAPAMAPVSAALSYSTLLAVVAGLLAGFALMG